MLTVTTRSEESTSQPLCRPRALDAHALSLVRIRHDVEAGVHVGARPAAADARHGGAHARPARRRNRAREAAVRAAGRRRAW